VADYRRTGAYEPAGNWSSFATPVAAGSVGLLVQKASREGLFAGTSWPRGANCLVKAVLINSAVKLPYWHKGRPGKTDDHAVPLDYSQGSGALDAVEASRHISAGRHAGGEVPARGWDLNTLEFPAPAARTYTMVIDEPAGGYITATVAWNRHYKKRYPFEHDIQKDSDLRLELWAAGPPGNRLLDYSDSRSDNVEHIRRRTEPGCTRYNLVVSFSRPPLNGSGCLYAAAWSVTEPPPKGPVWYDLNADGAVDERDLMKLLENLLESMARPRRYYHGDIDENGLFDLSDVQQFMRHEGIRTRLGARKI
jgi:hypothetical protein